MFFFLVKDSHSYFWSWLNMREIDGEKKKKKKKKKNHFSSPSVCFGSWCRREILHYYHSILNMWCSEHPPVYHFFFFLQEESVYLDFAPWRVSFLIAVIADCDDVTIFITPDVQIPSAYPLLWFTSPCLSLSDSKILLLAFQSSLKSLLMRAGSCCVSLSLSVCLFPCL